MPMPHSRVIGDEARILSTYSNDIDNFRRKYSLREDTTNEQILVNFVAPKIISFEDNRFLLLQNSNMKPLKANRYYRPDYVSYDEYGSTNLWGLLLFINDIPCIEDFTVENILVPTKSIIISIASKNIRKNLLQEIVPLYDYPLKATKPLYFRKKPVPVFEDQPYTAPKFYPADIYFMRESFTIDVVNARQRYVDLEYDAIPESVVLKVKDNPSYLYDKHYKLIKGSRRLNRVTWDPRSISGGIGLVSVLVEDVEFEISYTRKSTTGPISILTPTIEVSVLRPIFYEGSSSTADVITSNDVKNLENTITDQSQEDYQFNISIPSGSNRIIFAYPASLRAVSSVKYTDFGDMEVKDVFVESEIYVTFETFEQIKYRVYSYKLGVASVDDMTYEVTI